LNNRLYNVSKYKQPNNTDVVVPEVNMPKRKATLPGRRESVAKAELKNHKIESQKFKIP